MVIAPVELRKHKNNSIILHLVINILGIKCAGINFPDIYDQFINTIKFLFICTIKTLRQRLLYKC